MTLLPAMFAPAHPQLRALAVLVRASGGLLAHALSHPFASAIIDGRTGRVVAR